tara:strand:+ start:603 stop:824 length:222 start_codon:yes stop_codon:yes gene_type:complete
MKTLYLTSLTYGDAVEVMDHINLDDGDDYSYIAPGCLVMKITDEKLNEVESLLKSKTKIYNISETLSSIDKFM